MNPQSGANTPRPLNHEERLAQALFSGEKGAQTSNVRFFLGESRNISQEQLCEEANKALTQIELGAAKGSTSLKDENDVERVHIEKFLASL